MHSDTSTDGNDRSGNPDCPTCGHTLWLDRGRWKCSRGHCHSFDEIGHPRQLVTDGGTQESVRGQSRVRCDSCGTEMWDTEDQRREMELHEAECDGVDDPSDRFEKGDRVQFSDFGLERLGRNQREGVVAGFSKKHDHCVRVRWDGRKTPQRLAHRFVKPIEGGQDGE